MTLDEIQKNGVVGAGGAGFPTHVKLSAQPEFLIMNAAECEPLLHKDIVLLENHIKEVLRGFQIAISITGAGKGIIGIKEKHGQIIDFLSQRLNGHISIKSIGDFYPAGDEITLIHQVTGRIVQPGNLPISAGCIVQNVETLYNIGLNTPVVEKFITVAGEVESPLTVKVPIGTRYADVLSHFKITTPNYVVRSGGLMMGILEKDLDQVVTKCTGGLIVLPSDHYCATVYNRFANEHQTVRIAKAGCDQCSFCTELCPRYLLGHPVRPEVAMRNRMFSREKDTFSHLGNVFCCECNLCTLYSCPEGLDPKGAVVIEKKNLQSKEERWEGLPVLAHPMMEYRKVPTKKLMQRLDVIHYADKGPLADFEIIPSRVRIPLQQHMGAPAIPIVGEGESIKKYDLIAEANGNVSANIHASIEGKIESVNQNEIVIQR